MECRTNCGACCIAISIRQPFFGMPGGKPAGVPCVHLDGTMGCELFGDERRPTACDAFIAERAFCGENRQQALMRLTELELQTISGSVDLECAV